MVVSIVESLMIFPWMDLCGDLATMAGIALALSPLPTIQAFKFTQSVGELPLLPYSAMVMNSFLWGLYGLLMSERKVLVANVVPFGLAVYYVSQYAQFDKKGNSSIIRHGSIVSCVVLVCLLVITFTTLGTAAEVVGTIAVVASVLMYGGPLAAMKHVIKTKSADCIPLPYLAGVASCSLLWFLYGLLGVHDMKIVIPNGLGLIASSVQYGLVVKYGTSSIHPPLLEEVEQEIAAMIETTMMHAEGIESVADDVPLVVELSKAPSFYSHDEGHHPHHHHHHRVQSTDHGDMAERLIVLRFPVDENAQTEDVPHSDLQLFNIEEGKTYKEEDQELLNGQAHDHADESGVHQRHPHQHEHHRHHSYDSFAPLNKAASLFSSTSSLRYHDGEFTPLTRAASLHTAATEASRLIYPKAGDIVGGPPALIVV